MHIDLDQVVGFVQFYDIGLNHLCLKFTDMRLPFLFLLLLLFTRTALAQTVSYGNNPSAGAYLDVNGIRLYYETYGSGQPLLLLHGNGGSIGGRADIIPRLAEKYRVIAVDSRCHGRSGCMTGDLNYELMASDIEGLLRHLKVDSALVWGHSDGGILALILGYTYPKGVRKLLVTGANVLPDTTALYPEIVAMMRMYPRLPDTLMRKHIKLMVHHPNIPWGRLSSIQAPVLVMAGDRDAIRNEHTVRIFQAIPRAQLCILPGTTHFIANERPALFRTLLFEFFDRPFAMPSTVEVMRHMAQQMMK